MSWPGLVRWEWFKLRGRRVTAALLVTMIGFSVLAVVIRFGDYQFVKDRDVVDEILFNPGAPLSDQDPTVNCTRFVLDQVLPPVPAPYTAADVDVDATLRECTIEVGNVEERIDRLIGEFTLPTSVGTAIRWTTLVSIPFIAFFTVLVVGSEYGWGTLRSALMKGPGRTRFLAAKLAMILVLLAAAWLAVLAAIVVTSLITTALASGVGHGDLDAAAIGSMLGDTARAWFAALPYVALAALLAIALSGWAGGMLAATGFAIAYFFVDLFSIGRIIKLFDGVDGMRWFSSLAEYDLGWNTAAWMFGENGEPITGFALAGAIGVVEYPSEAHAFVVQAVFLAAFTVLAFVLFNRRDVAGPSG